MEHWRFLHNHRRDVAIIKGIQERLVALVDAARQNVPDHPGTVAPLQVDDNALSALDAEIAAMQQETSAVLALAKTSNNHPVTGGAAGVAAGGIATGGQQGPSGGGGASPTGGAARV